MNRILDRPVALPRYSAAMRQVVFQTQSDDLGIELNDWALLPGLCCEAAGAEFERADPVTAAWYLIYASAHLVDSIEDDDPPEPWWEGMGKGAAFSIATGLYLAALGALDKLSDSSATAEAARPIQQGFVRQLMTMANGQHRDLTIGEPDTGQWLEIAEEKSGAFFELATWAGARLAIEDPVRLQYFGDFGRALGVLLQIYDDLQDLRRSAAELNASPDCGRHWSLPVAYAMEVSPPDRQGQIRAALDRMPEDSGADQELKQLLEAAGAQLYIAALIERSRGAALRALETAAAPSAARRALSGMIPGLDGDPAPRA